MRAGALMENGRMLNLYEILVEKGKENFFGNHFSGRFFI